MTVSEQTRAGGGVGAVGVEPKLVHLGCGLIAPEGWINLDGSFSAWLAHHKYVKKALVTCRIIPKRYGEYEWPRTVQLVDLRKRLPFADNSVDAVYSSHVLEHLYRVEAQRLLKEAYRILKPGAVCRTLVPDLHTFVMQYLGQRGFDPKARYTDDPARFLSYKLAMRWEAPPGGNWFYTLAAKLRDFNSHKWMYDGPSLVRLMSEAGFVDCRAMGFLETAIPRLERVEREDRYDTGVAVEGRKPLPAAWARHGASWPPMVGVQSA